MEVEGRVAGSSNQALLVRVRLGDDNALACYKAHAAERPLWDFPDGLWRREVAAYELDQLLGFDLVPTTVARGDDAPFGPGSLQWWVEDNEDDHYFTLRERDEFQPWLRRLCTFDLVANNADRKSGHVLYDDERLWAIDHGLCFHEQEKLRTVIWDFAGEALHPDDRDALKRFSESDADALLTWLRPDEVERTLVRAKVLAEAGHFPAPDTDGDWPPYPWPLV